MSVTSGDKASGFAHADAEVAARNLPVLLFDTREPFLPSAVGYTCHRENGPSVSAEYHIDLKGADCAVEYSIWYDWDIQHLYELEHVWVYLDAAGAVLRVAASAHGNVNEMWREPNVLPLVDGRVVLLAEPGKHAHAAGPEILRANKSGTDECCGAEAGKNTILIPDLLDGAMGDVSIYDHHLSRNYLKSRAFQPSFIFDRNVDLATIELLPWTELKASIPDRMRAELTRLRAAETGVKAVFLDSGDTLIDEGSQIFAEGELVLEATPIPGGDRLVAELKSRGYLVALVADGLVESFENVLGTLGFLHMFDALAISETVGVDKPDRAMFDAAVTALGLTSNDHSGCVMLGNNLERDIAGANRLGMRSVWLNWTTRYPTEPQNADEVPDFTIGLPLELLDVLAEMDANATNKKTNIDGRVSV